MARQHGSAQARTTTSQLVSPHTDASESIDTHESLLISYRHAIVACCQDLYEQPHTAHERFAEEVRQILAGRAFLSLSASASSPLSPLDYVAFTVGWQRNAYGVLCVLLNKDSKVLCIAPSAALELANLCGWCLRVLENGAFVAYQQRGVPPDVVARVRSLTAREREVLMLMIEGFSNREMAVILQCRLRTIDTHQQRMYLKLGVHSQREAILAGHAAGLLSVLTPHAPA